MSPPTPLSSPPHLSDSQGRGKERRKLFCSLFFFLLSIFTPSNGGIEHAAKNKIGGIEKKETSCTLLDPPIFLFVLLSLDVKESPSYLDIFSQKKCNPPYLAVSTHIAQRRPPHTRPKLLLSGRRESGARLAQEHKTCAAVTNLVAQGWRKTAQGWRKTAQGKRKTAQGSAS